MEPNSDSANSAKVHDFGDFLKTVGNICTKMAYTGMQFGDFLKNCWEYLYTNGLCFQQEIMHENSLFCILILDRNITSNKISQLHMDEMTSFLDKQMFRKKFSTIALWKFCGITL